MKTADQIAKALELLPMLQKLAHASGDPDVLEKFVVIEAALEWAMDMDTNGVEYIDKVMEGGKMFDTRVN